MQPAKQSRIAIDYTAAASHWPGVGRYGRELVRALVRLPETPPLLLFELGRPGTLPSGALGITEALAEGRVERRLLDGTATRGRVLRARAALLRRGLEAELGDVALVHRALPGHPRVLRRTQVQPLFELPSEDPGAEEVRALAREVAHADHVVVGSASGREAVVRALHLDPAAVTAVRTGADHWLRDADPLDELPSDRPPTLVALGALSPARRPLELLRAFERLHARRPEVHLWFDGRPGAAAPAVQAALEASPARAAVTWRRAPVEADLPDRVAGAAVLVHLSAGELSPVTPLEALHFGTAVVASDLPAFREALPASALVSRATESDPDALASALERALEEAPNPAAREARRAAAAPFTWAACAQDHLAMWAQVLGE